MTFTHALATNNYGPAKFIVDGSAANGTHTTIATALTSSSSGDTIFIRPGTYTENLTLKAGVNLTAYGSDSSLNATGKVIIIGTCTLTTAGSVTIYGIQLQTNSAALLAVTGTVASIVNLQNCYLNITNNDGITFSTSNASGAINITNCAGDLGTTGIKIFAHTSAGTLKIQHTEITNSGASTTASTATAGTLLFRFSALTSPITTSSTNAIGINNGSNTCTAINATSITVGGSGTNFAYNSFFGGGTASTISVGSELYLRNCVIAGTNTNSITGAGILNYNGVAFSEGSTSTMNTTTQVAQTFRPGITRSAHQPAFLATATAGQTNITGNNTIATITFETEIFDQNADYNGTNTFTAPVTGRYFLQGAVSMAQVTNGTTGVLHITTSNREHNAPNMSFTATQNNSGSIITTSSVLTDMDAADTAVIRMQINGIGADTADANASTNSYFSGYLVC